MKSVTKVVQEMLMNSNQPLKAIAFQVSKPYSTLLRELNPYDKGAKLGVETLLDLMRVTQNYQPLHYMAQEMGFTLVPANPQMQQTDSPGFRSYSCRLDAAIPKKATNA